jgi:hypothetical protein
MQYVLKKINCASCKIFLHSQVETEENLSDYTVIEIKLCYSTCQAILQDQSESDIPIKLLLLLLLPVLVMIL